MFHHSPNVKILERIRDLCSAAQREHRRAVDNYHDDSAELWLDLANDLEGAANGVKQNYWPGVFETIRHVELALIGDWSWRQ